MAHRAYLTKQHEQLKSSMSFSSPTWEMLLFSPLSTKNGGRNTENVLFPPNDFTWAFRCFLTWRASSVHFCEA